MRLKSLFICILLIIFTLAAASASAEPVRHKLPSGLTVITSENHEAPVVTFQVWVRAGSAFERPHEYGITHLIEHMIFKGSPKYPAGQMAGRIEGLGGEINAYTTFDHTNYYVTAASRNAGEVLELLADAVVNASFGEKELAREKEVVVEEIRMGEDDPDRRRSKALFRLTFGDHPYGRPVIGSKASVRAITRKDILDYRARWYKASNMLVVAVGDFKTAELLPRIKKAFAKLPAGSAPDFKLPPVKVPKGPRLLVMREKVRQASVVLSWRIPGLPSDEVYPLDMAATVAGDGETSRLYAALKEKKGLVDSVSAGAFTPKGIGLFEVEAQMAPDKAASALEPLLGQTLSLISKPPISAELKRARVNLAASFIRGRQTMQGQARTLGYFEMMRGGFEKAKTYLERFKALGAGEVTEAARAYLTPGRLAVVIQIPEGAKVPDQKELAKMADKIFAGLKPTAARAEEKPARFVLSNGLTLIVRPRHAVPLTAFTLAAPGGQAAETAQTAGIYQLWAETITRGSKNRSYEELTLELESMAAGLSGFSGKSACGVSGSFLAADWRRGLELLSEVWLSPTFQPDQVRKAKAEQLAGLRAQQDSPVSRAFLALRSLLYGNHPYAFNPLGSVEVLARLGQKDLLAAHKRVKGPKGAVLTVVGDVETDEVKKEVERLFGKAKGAVTPLDPAKVQPVASPRQDALEDKKAKQVQIVLGYLAPDATDPHRHAMEVLSQVLGGMGGRLFLDLREKRSLAYAVSPFYSDARQVGVFGVYMGVGVGKDKEALDGLARQLGMVRQNPPSAEEIKRAKAYILGGLAIGSQAYSAQASIMTMNELLGLGYLYQDKLAADISAVTPRQILDTAKKYLDPKHQVKVTLGP